MKKLIDFGFKTKILFALLFSAMFLLGCTSDVTDDADTSEVQAQDDFTTIGLSMGASLRTQRWLKDKESFVERAEELGADVIVKFANEDSDTQISQIENLIIQGVDALVIVPQDSERLSGVVERAHDSGISVVAYDRLIKDCELDFYISFDNVKVGEQQAQGVLDVVDEGKFAYIGGSETDNNAHLLKEGSMGVLQPKIDSGDIEIVLETFTDSWRPEVAYEDMKDFLDSGGEVDAVIAANDGTAYGVIQALEEFGLARDVPVSGQDAELTSCQRIISGEQTITVYKPIQDIAYKAAEVAVEFARGATPESNALVDNAMIDVPSYLLESIPITKDNMNIVIEDGFHEFEEVYHNVSQDKDA